MYYVLSPFALSSLFFLFSPSLLYSLSFSFLSPPLLPFPPFFLKPTSMDGIRQGRTCLFGRPLFGGGGREARAYEFPSKAMNDLLHTVDAAERQVP